MIVQLRSRTCAETGGRSGAHRQKASKWVDTELSAAIRKRVDDTGFRLIPIMIDDSTLPALVADYRGFLLKKVSDMEGIV
jgi:hypothetical protein